MTSFLARVSPHFERIWYIGGYGEVSKCHKLTDPTQVRAVKRIQKVSFARDELDDFIKETDSLKRLAHSNIIEIFEMFEDR